MHVTCHLPRESGSRRMTRLCYGPATCYAVAAGAACKRYLPGMATATTRAGMVQALVFALISEDCAEQSFDRYTNASDRSWHQLQQKQQQSGSLPSGRQQSTSLW